MADAILRYVGYGLEVDSLAVGECTVHRARDNGRRWWQLWFRVERETDGAPESFVVPIHPRGAFLPSGPGGKTWGLTRVGPGLWQVSPSINVVSDAQGTRTHDGPHPSARSLWHQTPQVSGVPDEERWILGAP